MTNELCFVLLFCCAIIVHADESEGRKLFGGYKITPRFCKPTRTGSLHTTGPNICMFNHECATRKGTVVGACMDGFLFGACCQIAESEAGELVESEMYGTSVLNNNLDTQTKSTNIPTVNVMSNGVSYMPSPVFSADTVITTAQDNEVVQINGRPEDFGSTTGVTHSSAETILLHSENNDILPTDFRIPGFDNNKYAQTTDRSSTSRVEDVTTRYGSTSPALIEIGISHSPYVTTSQGYQKPMFRPRPTSSRPDIDTFVLVPTITQPIKPNKTQELASIVNIISMLNDTSTTVPFLSSSKPIYMQETNKVQQSKATTNRPAATPFTVVATSQKQASTNVPSSRKPPSTSYVFSTTIPPKRTTQPYKKPTTGTITSVTKRPVTVKKPYVYSTSTTRPTYVTTNRPSTNKYSTSRPGTVTATKRPSKPTSYRPPSTSYVTGTPTKRPTTLNTHVIGPGFTVTKPTKTSYTNQEQFTPNDVSPPPTVIVLSPITPEAFYEPYESTTLKPNPVTQLTINNIVTANNNYHYSTSERPSPTVLITPKPSINNLITAGSHRPIIVTTEFTTGAEFEIDTSANDLINFPPVRNPNLNMSASVASSEDELDFTTPTFIEDPVLDQKVESFVNKIVESLQDPFNELKDVVYNKNKTTLSIPNSTRRPTTKKPLSTKKPTRLSSVRPTSSRPRPTTRKPTTKKPTAISTKRTTTTPTTTITTTRRTKPTRKITTTPSAVASEEAIEYEDDSGTEEELDYRRHCGIRPLMKSGRIVGGKGSTFGEWPWQVLVRESTWLGLFTKNKCGGVLISNKFVVTAAHCQPGFLASLVAVFGEYDISGELESKRSSSKNVRRVIVHRQYDAATFENDLALLELESPVQYDQHIVPICLPHGDEDFTGRMATVTGWGRLKYGGGVPSVLQEVQVPIMENHVCQEMFRTAGHSKVILESFLCAGYANGQKDSCEGDSGGPLVLHRPDGRWQLAGTVSHGIKCAAPYLPGVYMRTTFYKPWLESITGIN